MRHLSIEGGSLTLASKNQSRVAAVFEHCTNLDTLVLFLRGSTNFYKDLWNSSAALRSRVQRLLINEIKNKEEVELLLETVSPHLTVLSLRQTLPEHDPVGQWDVTRFAATLECLNIGIYEFGFGPGIVFPRLKTLCTAVIHRCDGLSITQYLTRFPNLRFLSLGSCRTYTSGEGFHQLALIREKNIATQARGRSWKELHTLDGPLSLLYAMGITCPVKHVQLDRFLQDIPGENHLDMWIATLEGCHAIAATLAVDTRSFAPDRLPSIVPPNGQITRLNLIIEIRDITLGLDDLEAALVTLVSSTPLRYFYLTLDLYWWDGPDDILQGVMNAATDHSGIPFITSSPDEFRHKLARAQPALQYFGLTTKIPRIIPHDPWRHLQTETNFWQISRSEDLGGGSNDEDKFRIEKMEKGGLSERGAQHPVVRQEEMLCLQDWTWGNSGGVSPYDKECMPRRLSERTASSKGERERERISLDLNCEQACNYNTKTQY
ncbi:hypothetical protein K474DRAFT_1726014 [Panus rudis PR-1116 ss-1]|nr:hypothetical protein K474DRAFT_1726014 [Panus rudis PR-1116 ss-1]